MKKTQLLWIIFGVIALLFLIGAASVQPGRPISQYPRVTTLQGTDIFPIARTNVVPATNMGVTGFVISNYVVSVSTGAVGIIAGTNVIITSTTNGTGGQTHTISVTNTFGSVVSPPLSSVQYNSNSVQSGSSLFVFTNSMVGIGTNAPAYPLHLFVADNTKTALEISYTNGAGNTVALQIRNGTGATNFQVEVGGFQRSITIHNSGAITGATATVTALNVTGGTLGAGKVLTDSGGTGAATWQAPSPAGALTPGVTNVASAADIVIDLAATNTPCVSVTNVAAHNISIVVSNPYPGRWFSFYIDGSGLATNNTLTWSSVAGVQLKWLDAVTNTLVLSNGYVNVSGWIATMNRNTNMVITYRDE